MGASAGLNLFFDQFHYALDTAKGALDWGDAKSPLTLKAEWRGTPPDLAEEIAIADRRGCDFGPVDITDATERRALAKLDLGRHAGPPRPAFGGAGDCR